MSKLINRSIRVRTHRDQPVLLAWEGAQVVVQEVLDQWEEAGLWWEGEPARRIYRVRGRDGRIYEVHQTLDAWSLYRVYD